MSKSVHYRLPDQLIEDAKALAKAQGVTVTDVIIKGIQSQLSPHWAQQPAAEPVKKPGKKRSKEAQPVTPIPEPKPIPSAINSVKQAPDLVAALKEKAAAKPWFRPYSKEARIQASYPTVDRAAITPSPWPAFAPSP